MSAVYTLKFGQAFLLKAPGTKIGTNIGTDVPCIAPTEFIGPQQITGYNS